MANRLATAVAIAALPLFAAACTSTASLDAISDPNAGFATVAARTGSVTGKQTVWVKSTEEARAVSLRVKELVHKKTIGPDTAVQVAILNNKGLQAAYAEVGMSAAEVWQEMMLENPRVSVGVTGVDPFRTFEASIINNILALATQPRRVAVADTRFRQAQLHPAEETLKLAADTRRAWINSVTAWETASTLGQAQAAADAASELAQKLGETGAFNKTGQAREHVFYAELAGQTAEARLAARGAKEALTRLMGLWGDDVDYQVPNALPWPSQGARTKPAIEAEALKNRVDLEIARLELEALAQSYGLTEATRYISDLDLLTGVEVEREEDDGEVTKVVSPRVEVEFAIPIFDTGRARMRKAELAYLRAANLLAEKAVNIRSQARSAYDAYRSTYDIAQHYRANVLPLRDRIEEESVLTFNGMITNTFELLADARAKLNSSMLAQDANRKFWLAEVDLAAAIFGGGVESGDSDGETVMASADADGE